MTVINLIQLALGIMRFANWITRKIDQGTWEKSGYQKAMLDQANAIKLAVGAAEEAVSAAKKMTPEELRRRLGDAT